MTILRSIHQGLYRYDSPEVCDRILNGSIRVSTLDYCRRAETPEARDEGEGFSTITSLPGQHSLNVADVARLLGVDASVLRIEGPNAFVTVGENAVVRTERVEAFVLCLSSLGNDEMMKRRFRGQCLRVTDPLRFFELVDAALRKKVSPDALGECVVDAVEYGSRVRTYLADPFRDAAFLKPHGPPRHFEQEAEVRGVWRYFGVKAQPCILDVPGVVGIVEVGDAA